MSTRSRIGYQLDDGTVRSIYCHNDGYIDAPHGVGYKLLTYFNNLASAQAIVSLGNLSSLYPKLAPPKNKKHSIDDPIKGVTVAYTRDRGEPDCKGVTDRDDARFFAGGEEYNYLFRHGMWLVQSDHGADERFKLPTDLTVAVTTQRLTA
jgi:hypothetical protein